eukprot:sb/3470363/
MYTVLKKHKRVDDKRHKCNKQWKTEVFIQQKNGARKKERCVAQSEIGMVPRIELSIGKRYWPPRGIPDTVALFEFFQSNNKKSQKGFEMDERDCRSNDVCLRASVDLSSVQLLSLLYQGPRLGLPDIRLKKHKRVDDKRHKCNKQWKTEVFIQQKNGARKKERCVAQSEIGSIRASQSLPIPGPGQGIGLTVTEFPLQLHSPCNGC